MIKKFSSNLAFQLATYSSYQKGKEYFQEGAVDKIWKEDNQYKAKVEGTRCYTVSIFFKDGEFSSNCNCPYDLEGICKHTVATILALTKDPNLSIIDFSKRETGRRELEKLLTKASDVQVRNFLEKLLIIDKTVRKDFTIFLQGPKETKATVLSYKEKIKCQLDELDLKDLLEAWYCSGDDYYDGYYSQTDYDEEIVGSIIGPFREEAGKYAENKNYAESVKIYQAIIEALLEKEDSLSEDYTDLGDWFIDEIYSTFEPLTKALTESSDANIKKIGIEYLCHLFEDKGFDIGQDRILESLKHVITKKSLAEIVLRILSRTKTKQKLEISESSLLTHLYFLVSDYKKFENLSIDNLDINPSLLLNLLKYYQSQNRKLDILKRSAQVLERFQKERNRSYSGYVFCSEHQKIEIEIRRFLDDVFDPQQEYQKMIENLEFLFFASTELVDYKKLSGKYKKQDEKEEFLDKMKNYFTKISDIETMFKVFKLENNKEEILGLVRKYKRDHVAVPFSEMVAVISNDYPKECFDSYKAKIKDMLKQANVRVYPEAVRHLKRMKKIGLDSEFEVFVDWLRTTYSRRYRFIEELNKQEL